ncbi:MAG: TIGR01212 family radical SAM protein [Lachnospiraceae bacterium]
MVTYPKELWLDKPYYSLHAYCKHTFHERCYKIALDGGFSCPNRDGKIGYGGCIFCSEQGSGDFSTSLDFTSSITLQITHSIQATKLKKKATKFIAYFQAYTSTYGSIQKLRTLYETALSQDEIIGISIATRPDCLADDVIDLLSSLQVSFPNKFIWVELGLQTIHEDTAKYIRRGYPLSTFEEAMKKLDAISIPVIVHVILGLPGETTSMILETITYLNQFHVFGVKYQLLHILKGTDLAKDYEQGLFEALTMDAYISLLALCITHTNPQTIIHRVTGDGPKDLLIAPLFSSNKIHVLNELHRYLKLHDMYQGRDLHDTRQTNLI